MREILQRVLIMFAEALGCYEIGARPPRDVC